MSSYLIPSSTAQAYAPAGGSRLLVPAQHLDALRSLFDLLAAERRVVPLLLREHPRLVAVELRGRVLRQRVGEDRAVAHAAALERRDHHEARAVGDVVVAGGGIPARVDRVENTLGAGAAGDRDPL